MTYRKNPSKMVALPYELDELYVIRFWRPKPAAPARMAAFMKRSTAEEFGRKRIEYGDTVRMYSIEGIDLVASVCAIPDVGDACDNGANAESVDSSVSGSSGDLPPDLSRRQGSRLDAPAEST